MSIEELEQDEITYDLHTCIVALQKIFIETGQEPNEEAIMSFSEEDPRQYPSVWVYEKVFRKGLFEALRIAGVDQASIERRKMREDKQRVDVDDNFDEMFDSEDEQVEMAFEISEVGV